MNRDPDNMDYNLHVMWRATLASLFLFSAAFVYGCTYNRNAPLIESHITANGNTTTVPLIGQ